MNHESLLVPGVVELHDDPAPSLYGRLLRDARRSRCVPVLLAPDATKIAGELPLPDDPCAHLDATDPFDVLARRWPGPCPPGCHCLEPFEDAFPRPRCSDDDGGPPDWSRHPSTLREAAALAYAMGECSTLAVVDAARPADVPLAIRWAGYCNEDDQDLVGLTAVLRSWEARFGAMLVHLSFSTLVLAVARPPRTVTAAEQVAAEHFAFCRDQNDPQNGTVYTPRTYAATIRGREHWRFWWD